MRKKGFDRSKEKQMSDIRSKDMDQHNRVCAQIDLDAIAYNMEQMKDNLACMKDLRDSVKQNSVHLTRRRKL